MVDARGQPGPLPAARPGRAPLITLLRELQARPAITRMALVKDGETVTWSRSGR